MLYCLLISFWLFSCSKGLDIKNDISNTAILQSNSTATKTTDGFFYTQIDGKLSKTVFMLSEINNFLSNGKASSLGTTKELQLSAKRKVKYIKKGGVCIVMLQKGTQVTFAEYLGDITVLGLANNGDSGGSGNQTDRCVARCELDALTCLEEFPYYPDNTIQICDWEFLECKSGCSNIAIHHYTITVSSGFNIKI